MNNEVLVSIITIVYNGSTSLERTIKSVIDQTYSHIEYIIIDGGSTDGTLEVIKKYNNSISFSISEKDEGISDAFNKGIKRAKGELIGMINCGDYYEIDAVAQMVNTYLNLGETNAKYITLHGKIRMFDQSRSNVYSPLLLKTFKYQMPVWHPTVFVNRNVYKDFAYDKTYRIAMDYELFSRVYSAKGIFVFVDALITNMNTDGVSNHQAAKGFKEVMFASRKNLGIYKLTSYFYYQYRSALNKFISIVKSNA